MRILIGVFAIALPNNSYAAEPKTEVRYQDVTSVDFDRALQLEGALLKPNANLVIEAKRRAFNPLIKLRVHFNDRMRLDVKNI